MWKNIRANKPSAWTPHVCPEPVFQTPTWFIINKLYIIQLKTLHLFGIQSSSFGGSKQNITPPNGFQAGVSVLTDITSRADLGIEESEAVPTQDFMRGVSTIEKKTLKCNVMYWNIKRVLSPREVFHEPEYTTWKLLDLPRGILYKYWSSHPQLITWQHYIKFFFFFVVVGFLFLNLCPL